MLQSLISLLCALTNMKNMYKLCSYGIHFIKIISCLSKLVNQNHNSILVCECFVAINCIISKLVGCGGDLTSGLSN